MATTSAPEEAPTPLFDAENDPSYQWVQKWLIGDMAARIQRFRRAIKYTAIIQFVYIIIRSMWKMIPTYLKGVRMEVIDQLILIVGVALFLVYRRASGYGKPEAESEGAMMLYSLLSLVLLAECFVSFWTYHVVLGPDSEDPYARDVYPFVTTTIINHLMSTRGLDRAGRDKLQSIMTPIEGGVELVALFIMAFGVYFSKEYVVDTREERRERETEAAAGKKDE